MSKFRRRKNLILPGLQLRVTFVFLMTSATMMSIMGLLLIRALMTTPELPQSAFDAVLPSVAEAFLVSLALMVPVTLMIGVLTTFVFAGPLYRMKRFLTETVNGEKPDDCFLRWHDELQDFAKLLNEATVPMRERVPAPAEAVASTHVEDPAGPLPAETETDAAVETDDELTSAA